MKNEPKEQQGEQEFSFATLDQETVGIGGGLARFFAGHVEHVFTRLNIPAPLVSDYISNLLIRATDPRLVLDAHSKYLLRGNSTLVNPIEMYQSMIPVKRDLALRTLLKEMGDYALYAQGTFTRLPWTGADEDQHAARVELTQVGVQAFRDASRAPLKGEAQGALATENETLLKVAEHFEMCAYVIGEVHASIRADAVETAAHGNRIIC